MKKNATHTSDSPPAESEVLETDAAPEVHAETPPETDAGEGGGEPELTPDQILDSYGLLQWIDLIQSDWASTLAERGEQIDAIDVPGHGRFQLINVLALRGWQFRLMWSFWRRAEKVLMTPSVPGEAPKPLTLPGIFDALMGEGVLFELLATLYVPVAEDGTPRKPTEEETRAAVAAMEELTLEQITAGLLHFFVSSVSSAPSAIQVFFRRQAAKARLSGLGASASGGTTRNRAA